MIVDNHAANTRNAHDNDDDGDDNDKDDDNDNNKYDDIYNDNITNEGDDKCDDENGKDDKEGRKMTNFDGLIRSWNEVFDVLELFDCDEDDEDDDEESDEDDDEEDDEEEEDYDDEKDEYDRKNKRLKIDDETDVKKHQNHPTEHINDNINTHTYIERSIKKYNNTHIGREIGKHKMTDRATKRYGSFRRFTHTFEHFSVTLTTLQGHLDFPIQPLIRQLRVFVGKLEHVLLSLKVFSGK